MIYETQPLVFGAYFARGHTLPRRTLTHTVLVANGRRLPLCRVQEDSIGLHETQAEIDAPPTCPTCLRRDPRFKKRRGGA